MPDEEGCFASRVLQIFDRGDPLYVNFTTDVYWQRKHKNVLQSPLMSQRLHSWSNFIIFGFFNKGKHFFSCYPKTSFSFIFSNEKP